MTASAHLPEPIRDAHPTLVRTIQRGLLTVAMLAMSAPLCRADDVDGPDCLRDWRDYGDAPQCIPAYPSGVVGKFPTCFGARCGTGTQEVFAECPARSTPPGAVTSGAVLHINNFDAWNLWLGCFGEGITLSGTDNDVTAKFSGGGANSACNSFPPVDCIEAAFETMSFGQDECLGDNDAGLRSSPDFMACRPASVTVSIASCLFTGAFLNVMIDMNGDGDWNDSFSCGSTTGTTCAFEWAIKNQPVPGGCVLYTTPEFMIGPNPGPSWMRVSVSTQQAGDNFPWDGAALLGGETEDYPAMIHVVTPIARASWGRLKTLYR